MKRHLAKLVFASVLLATSLYAAESLDRVIATVNRKPILASDVDDAAHFEALEQGKVPQALDSERKAVLNRVIERELICQQMPDTFEPESELIDRHIAELRAQFSTIKTDAAWMDLLASYGLDSELLREDVTLRLKVVHFLDVRLRPTVRVERDEVSDYYSHQLLPQLNAAGAAAEPIEKVRDKIEEVLLQQKMTEVFDAWVANLRSQGSIRILDPNLAAPPTTATEKSTASNR
jgi:peptidyl-prolyl cis-trans isomerase SurA